MIAEINLRDVEERFNRLETLVIDIKELLAKNNTDFKDDQEVIPIREIAGKGKLMSLPTFYKHVREGRIELLKLGYRSYVSKKAFYNAFAQNNLASATFISGREANFSFKK